jgi:restriction system protein
MFEPPSPPIQFVGRAEELHQLYGKIAEKHILPRIVAITGTAGIGKTALAIEFLRSVSSRFNPIWLAPYHLRGTAELFSSVLENVKEDKREAIIVLDDTERFEGPVEEFARDLLQIKRLRAVLVTARKIPHSIPKIDRLEVFRLRPSEGVALLAAHVLSTHTNPVTVARISDEDARKLEARAEGHPLLLIMIAALLKDHTVDQIIFRLNEGLHNLGLPLPISEKQIVSVVAPKIIVTNDALLQNLKRQPLDLHRISPRKFEELLAELLDDMGCEVKLTPASNDGGKDIIAVMNTPLGQILCLVEAKHYNPKRPVQVSLVRQLFGAYMDHGANSAMLVTSSRFTRGAKQFQSRHEYQIRLKEYDDVVEWIQNYKRGSAGNFGPFS